MLSSAISRRNDQIILQDYIVEAAERHVSFQLLLNYGVLSVIAVHVLGRLIDVVCRRLMSDLSLRLRLVENMLLRSWSLTRIITMLSNHF